LLGLLALRRVAYDREPLFIPNVTIGRFRKSSRGRLHRAAQRRERIAVFSNAPVAGTIARWRTRSTKPVFLVIAPIPSI